MATKILTPAHMDELETGLRHNNRPAETRVRGLAGVALADIDELSSLLDRLGVALSTDPSTPIPMIGPFDLLDMEVEMQVIDDDREAEEEQEIEIEEMDEDSPPIIALHETGDVDDAEPQPVLTLAEAKNSAERLFQFVTENLDFLRQSGSSSSADYFEMMDTVRYAIQRMTQTSNTRQASITQFFTPHTASNP